MRERYGDDITREFERLDAQAKKKQAELQHKQEIEQRYGDAFDNIGKLDKNRYGDLLDNTTVKHSYSLKNDINTVVTNGEEEQAYTDIKNEYISKLAKVFCDIEAATKEKSKELTLFSEDSKQIALKIITEVTKIRYQEYLE